MKKIRYILGIMLSVCLVASGCQNLTEPEESTLPTVETGNALNITTHSATITGKRNPEHRQIYFLFSTSVDLSDAQQLYITGGNSSGSIINNLYQVNLYDLEKNHTYYYVLCVSDGVSEIRGEVKSFTTLNNYKIGKVTYTDWDGTVKEASSNYSPIGITLNGNSGNIYHNLKSTLDGSTWNLPEEIPAGSVYYAYAYWPYSPKGYQNKEYGYVPIQTYKYDGIDYLYAQSKPNEDNATVDINLQHAMAKVVFHFSIGQNNQNDNIAISGFTISNGEKVLPTSGDLILNENGYINSSTYAFSEPLNYSTGFELQKGSAYDVIIYSIPTSNTGTIVLTLNISDGSSVNANLEITNTTSWKKGNTYEYDVVYERSAITIGDVVIREWENNEGGDITVND